MPRWTPDQLTAYEMRTAKAHNTPLVGDAHCSEGDQEMARMAGQARGGERDLHARIFDECRRRGWIALHGSMSERTHRTTGEWDFTIVADRGRVFFVECKSATGKLRPEQAALIAWAKKLGHEVHVVRSFEEFLNVIKSNQ